MTPAGLAATWRALPDLVKRLPLVLLAVVACYRFEWTGLRYATSEVALRLAEWRGFPAARLGTDLIAWGGHRFQFGIACTFADVLCGAIPLLWIGALGATRNAVNVLAFAAGLLAFNLVRRCTTDIVFGSVDLPWSVLDQALGGLSYFLVWMFLVRWRERHGLTVRVANSARPATA